MPTTVERVIRCMTDVFKNKGLRPPALSSTTRLAPELGLDSLDYAELIIRLETEFGRDPLQDGQLPELKTIADLAKLYEQR